MTGEARVDARGLAIHDQTQGWTLRVGEVSREMYLSRAEMLAVEEDRDGFYRWQEEMQDASPVLGVFWSVRF